MMKQASLVLVLSLIVAACGSTSTPGSILIPPIASDTVPAPTATLTQAPITSTTTPAPAATLTQAPTSTVPDPCADATSSEARERLAFEAIVPCLNTPQRVVAFMVNNLRWDGGWDNSSYGDNAYSPAREVYESGTDDCDGLAEFAACVLSRNGYEAYNVGISILGPSGHNVAGYVGDDGLKYAINNGQGIDGPFDTWEELAQFFIDGRFAAPAEGVLWLFEPCINERAIGDAVLNLSHTELR